jgi:hypothetical protein
LNWHTFSSWKGIIRQRDAEAKRSTKIAKREDKRSSHRLFVPLVPQSTDQPNGATSGNVVAEITFAGGCLRVLAGADANTLRALLLSLKELSAC